jgi:hypothetical protein
MSWHVCCTRGSNFHLRAMMTQPKEDSDVMMLMFSRAIASQSVFLLQDECQLFSSCHVTRTMSRQHSHLDLCHLFDTSASMMAAGSLSYLTSALHSCAAQ